MATRVVELARSGSSVINKKYGMSREEFERDHLRAGVPVVIGDATAAWPARTTFTPAMFRTRFGDRKVTVGDREYRLADLLDELEKSSPDKPAPYPCNFDLDTLFPELVAEVEPRHRFSLPDRTNHPLIPRRLLGGAATFEIFFGGPGGKFPYMHYDYMGLHAFINELVGRKEFTAIPPHHTAYVYPDPENPWKSQVDNHHAPDLAKWPLFEKAEKVTFEIGPGETLFIPNGWWHTARSLELTISVAFDMLEESNWSRFRNEVQAMMKTARREKRVAADLYLRALGPLLSLRERLP